jgi:hypothetical protein
MLGPWTFDRPRPTAHAAPRGFYLAIPLPFQPSPPLATNPAIFRETSDEPQWPDRMKFCCFDNCLAAAERTVGWQGRCRFSAIPLRLGGQLAANCAQAFGPRLMGAAARRPWIRYKSETETLQLRFHLANRQRGSSIAILIVSPVTRRTWTSRSATARRWPGGRSTDKTYASFLCSSISCSEADTKGGSPAAELQTNQSKLRFDAKFTPPRAVCPRRPCCQAL